MKKITAIVLVLILLLAECTSASAASVTKKSNNSTTKKRTSDAIPVEEVYATSELIENGLRYKAEQAADGKTSTCWVEGADGYGIGESITLYLDGSHTVSRIAIAAGWTINDELFNLNAKPKTLNVYFSSLPDKHYELTLDKTMSTQSFAVYESDVRWVTFEIVDVYKGEKGVNDTCISEITLYE